MKRDRARGVDQPTPPAAARDMHACRLMMNDVRASNLDGKAKRAPWSALLTGATGAATVTLAHEVVRQLVPNPPRMDRLGMSALARILRFAGLEVPRADRLRGYTLLGDLVGNAMFYAPLALSKGKRPVLRGLFLGAAAGIGAVVLTPLLGLPRRHRGTTLRTQAITVALYAAGGLAAGAVASVLARRESPASSVAVDDLVVFRAAV